MIATSLALLALCAFLSGVTGVIGRDPEVAIIGFGTAALFAVLATCAT